MRASVSGDPLLRWLRATIVNSVRQRHDDLTLRQLAVMLITYQEEETQTVRGLARSLRISRPAISRALDRLGEAGLTRRQTDPRDRRSVVIRRTRKGIQRMQQWRALMEAPEMELSDVGAIAAPKSKKDALSAAPPAPRAADVETSQGTNRL